MSFHIYYHIIVRHINSDTSDLHPTPVDGQVMLEVLLLLIHDPLTSLGIVVEAEAPALLPVAETKA